MNITVEEDVSALKSLSHHHLCWAVLWALFHAWSNPLPIEIQSTQWASIVTNDNTIWIKHWNDFKDKVISQVLGNFIFTDQELQYTFHNERGITFSWMDSTGNDNGPSYSYFFWSWAEVGNDCHFTIVSSNGFAHNSFSDSIFLLWLTKSYQKFRSVRISVWVTMRSIDLVFVMHELYLEGKSVVESSTLLLESVWEVTNVGSITIPSISLSVIRLCFFFGVKQWFHSLVIRTFWLDKIDNIELVSGEFLNILHSEVEPLGICSCIVIVL